MVIDRVVKPIGDNGSFLPLWGKVVSLATALVLVVASLAIVLAAEDKDIEIVDVDVDVDVPDSDGDEGPTPGPMLVDGSIANCTDFVLDLGLIDVNIPDPGWVWVDPGRRFRSVTGLVTRGHVSHTDFPAVHDSHDFVIDILVDPGQEDILSDVGKDNPSDPRSPDTLHIEWETGTFPTEVGRNSPERFFPKWAWPIKGDRVWAEGHWVFDCGHPTEVGGEDHSKTEIHPIRAIATMRDQVGTLPGTGITPVPITSTDLYIHGRAGYVVDTLYCGQELIISADPDSCAVKTTPIDEDFEFYIHMPPKPFPSAVPAVFYEDGPGNTIGIDPILEPTPIADPDSVRVTVPLAGSGVADTDVYARIIKVGWLYPPDPLPRHFKLTLNKMDLHEDHELDPGDCECTFFWMSVDKAPAEWYRLVDFALETDRDVPFFCPEQTHTMNGFDDDSGFGPCDGNGEMDFEGPIWDFYVQDGQTFTVRAKGYDQDCLDDYFGDHHFDIVVFLDCYFMAALELNPGDNDKFTSLSATFGPPVYGVGAQDISADGEYELEFSIEEIPVEVEDTADLRLTKFCQPHENAPAGQVITCTILVDNLGPGLPRNVVVEDMLVTNVDTADYTMGFPTFTFADGLAAGAAGCLVTVPDEQFTCELGTVPVDGRAIITVDITSNEGGDFDNDARVSSDSLDPDLTNNHAFDDLTAIPVADLSLRKDDSADPVVAGNDLTYTLIAANLGPSTATNVVMSDILPAEVSVVSVSGSIPSSCTAGTPGDPHDPTRCTFDSLDVFSVVVMTISVTVESDALGFIHNDASVSSDAFDPDNSNNIVRERTTVVGAADLSISKVGIPASVIAGLTLTYRLVIVNHGPSLATSVRILDTLPQQVMFLQATIANWDGTCVHFDVPVNEVTCQLGNVPPSVGSPIIIFIEVLMRPHVSHGFLVDNYATVSSSTTDPFGGNDASQHSTPVTAQADLEIQMDSSCALCSPPETIAYTITVINQGPSDAQDVVVTDILPLSPNTQSVRYVFDTGGCLVDSSNILTCNMGTLSAGSSVSFEIYIVTVQNLGVITNRARVTTSTTDLNSMNNVDTKSVLVG